MMRAKINEANPDLPHAEAGIMLRRWFRESGGGTQDYLWADNAAVSEWFKSQVSDGGDLLPGSEIDRNLTSLKEEYSMEQVKRIGQTNSETALQAAMSLLEFLTPEQRAQLRSSLGASA